MAGLLIRLFRKAYNKNMFITNSATCMLLFGIGDGITQYIECNKNEISSSNQSQLNAIATSSSSTMIKLFQSQDWIRTSKMVAVGSVIGPLGHVWYTFLDRKFPKKTKTVILRKLFIDQLCFAPFLNVVFITGLHLLDSQCLVGLKDALKEKFLPLYTYDCAIWPPAQLINFYFVSPQQRVLYVNVVTLIWNCVSSFIMYNDVSLHSTFE